jgi:hypothetical protein
MEPERFPGSHVIQGSHNANPRKHRWSLPFLSLVLGLRKLGYVIAGQLMLGGDNAARTFCD